MNLALEAIQCLDIAQENYELSNAEFQFRKGLKCHVRVSIIVDYYKKKK